MNEMSATRRPQRWDEPFGDERLAKDILNSVLSLPTFSNVTADQFPPSLSLQDILKNDARIRVYSRGDIIVRKGDYGNSVFIIMKGSVRGALNAEAERSLDLQRKVIKRSFWGALSQLWRNSPITEQRTAVTAQSAGVDKLGHMDIRVKYMGRERRRVRTGTIYTGLERRSRSFSSNISKNAVIATVRNYDDFVKAQQTFSLAEPQMFGEIAALARSPRTATILADEDQTELLELRWQGLRDIRKWSAPFREHIDHLYRERSLALHLKETPLFSHVDDEMLAQIVSLTSFETHGGFEWNHSFKQLKVSDETGADMIGHEPVILAEGNYLDGVFLIRSGFVRVSRQLDHGEKTIGYLSKNSIFGLTEMIDHWRNGSTLKARSSLRAIGYVDILRVPSQIIEKFVLPSLPESFLSTLTNEDLSESDSINSETVSEDELNQPLVDFLVDNRIINGTATMLINTERCVNCDDCVRACAEAHDGNPRFVRHGEKHADLMIANACMHCIDPVCLIGCPTGAIHRDQESGNVIINDLTCIGCATCANSCPYHNIRMVDVRGERGNLWAGVDGMPIQKATKCDLCVDQLGGPACQRACPHDALIRMDMRDTKALAQWIGR